MMTKKSRMILAAAVLLAIGVAANVILLLTTAVRTGSLSSQTAAVSIILLIAGAVSVPVIYFAKIRKSKTEKLLDNAFFEGYETIKEIVLASRLPKNTISEILDDVLDLMVTARHNHKTLSETIADPRGFALEIIEQYGGKKKYGLMSFVDSLVYMAGFILGASAYMWLKEPKGVFHAPVDVSMLLFFGVVSFWLVPYIKLNMAERPKIIFLPIAIGIAFIASAEVMRRFFYEYPAVRWLLDGQVNIISGEWILAIFLIAIPALILLKVLLKKSRLDRLAKDE